MKRCFSFLFIISALFFSGRTLAQSHFPDSSRNSFRLFEEESVLDVSLKFDLSAYFRDKPQDQYLKAEMVIRSANDSIKRDIRLRTRGIFRKNYCLYAPIEFNFRKANFGFSDLDSISKLKLVTQCSARSEDAGYILKEYLVYKLFNVLTDTSFRVRLLNMTFYDSEGKRRPVRQYGFVIEPLEMLTARTNTIAVKSSNLTQADIMQLSMDRVALFNYMVGNYDWSVPGQHNVKVVKTLAQEKNQSGIVIPYDFDWSGVVNASYAIPAENMGIQNVRQRLFLGMCRKREVFIRDLRRFLYYKEALYRVINDFPYLKKYDKLDLIKFLDEFLNDTASGNLVSTLQNTCKVLNPK